MKKFLLLFKVGVAIAILITMLGFSGCTNPKLALTGKPLEWKNATEVVSPEVIQSILQQTTSIPANQWASVPVRATKMHGQHSIVLLSFPQICGQLGCLSVAFPEQNPHPIWNAYWNPNLPKGIPAILQHNQQDIPAFVLNQLNGQQIQQILYAWDGSQYHPERILLNP
ncbi:hypothetical protein ACQ4M3_34345 [Leptolyngbya sp. AN03gr2]|uniref:hypothetical protein n=1 Tax=unclassified Leptolyngbya TaxID=2650499 RepID=UPI003D310D9A